MPNSIARGALFSSFEELKLAILDYGEKNNVDIHVHRSRTLNAANKLCPAKIEKSNPVLKYYNLDYRCIHGGDVRKRGTGVRNATTFRKECPFRIFVSVSSDGQYLQVTKLNAEHNHEVSNEMFRQLPKQRRLPKAAQNEVVSLLQLQANKKLVRDKVMRETQKIVTLRDLSNLVRKEMSESKDTRRLLVIDTDCGSDDAMAIMAALGLWGRGSHRLVAITCCFGNTTVEHVCQNVLRVLHACKETEIPVYGGSSGPLLKHPDTPEIVHGSDGFGDCAHLFPTGNRQVEKLPAATALVQLSQTHGSITLAALGPLTNIALAQRLDPGFTKRLEKIVFLGGNYKGVGNTTESAEFNFYCDPEAAHIVLSEAECPVQMVPWETTMEYGIEWEDFDALMETPTDKAHLLKAATSIVREICVRDGYSKFLDCDLLAVAVALRPECVTGSRRTCASVECSGTLTRGMVVCQKPRPSRNEIEIVEKLDENILNRLRKEMVQ